MLTETLDIDAHAFGQGTGWEIKPEGACKGEVCVPLGGGDFDAATTAERLGMAVVHDEIRGLYAFGPETLSGHALATAEAADVALEDLDGNTVDLSSFRGKKLVLVAWAPY